jgi:hypothetical protein
VLEFRDGTRKSDKLLVIVRQLLSLYSRFYKATMLESTNATSEGKNANVFLDI